MKLYTLFLSLILISACSQNLRPFNQRMYEKYRWTKEELKKIQFYLSEDLVLYKKSNSRDSRIQEGSVVINSEIHGEKIKFKSGTPGVFLFSPKTNRLAISFSDDEDSNKYLMFGPNDRLNGDFALLAKEWEKRGGTVTYNNQEYFVNSTDAMCTLLIDIKKASKVSYTVKVEKGRRI
jgi:hypothetical protein